MLYQRKSRMAVRPQQKWLEHFVAGTTARAAAMLGGVQANTAIRFYQRLRRLRARKVEREERSDAVEVAESSFGGVRKGRRGRGAAGKVPVFGRLTRGGTVYTASIPTAQAATLIPIIREKVMPDRIV
jgi:transposase